MVISSGCREASVPESLLCCLGNVTGVTVAVVVISILRSAKQIHLQAKATVAARLLSKVQPGLVAPTSNFLGATLRRRCTDAVKIVLVERHEGVDSLIDRAAPSRAPILVVPS
jgi:hypothetical protein